MKHCSFHMYKMVLPMEVFSCMFCPHDVKLPEDVAALGQDARIEYAREHRLLMHQSGSPGDDTGPYFLKETNMSESHADLVGLSDMELRLRSGAATHQHYEGGLYKYCGPLGDADTGEPVLGKDGLPRVLYLHMYPHESKFWVRDCVEFFGTVAVEGEPAEVARFRPIG